MQNCCLHHWLPPPAPASLPCPPAPACIPLLQGVGRALQQLLPKEVPLNLRLPDNYVKAFYIPLTELPHWAQTHPEYSAHQVLALTACIAESSQMKKREKAALLAQIENNLQAMSLGGPGAL